MLGSQKINNYRTDSEGNKRPRKDETNIIHDLASQLQSCSDYFQPKVPKIWPKL